MINKVDNGLKTALDAKASVVARNPHWPSVEKAILQKHPKCLACDVTDALQVHHVHPFHYCIGVGRPDLELDERNLVVLCETESKKPMDNHHLLIGHGGDFKLYNSHVLEDAKAWYGMKSKKIQESAQFKERQANRPKAFQDMTYDEKKAYRDMLDKELPFNGPLGFRWPEPIPFDQVVKK